MGDERIGKMSLTDGVPIFRDGLPDGEPETPPHEQPTEEFDSAAVARGVARAERVQRSQRATVLASFIFAPETMRIMGD